MALVYRDPSKKYKLTTEECRLSKFISEIIEDCDGEEEIPIMNMEDEILGFVVKYMGMYVANPMEKIQKPIASIDMEKNTAKEYADFIDSISLDQLMKLKDAADYLHIEPLLDLCFCKISTHIKNRDENYIRETFKDYIQDVVDVVDEIK